MTVRIVILSVVLPLLFLAPSPSYSLVKSVWKGGAEVMEALSRSFGKEVVEAGGEKAVLETAEELVGKHGEVVIGVLKELGPQSMGLMERYGDAGVEILARWGRDGQNILRNSGDAVVPLYRRHGAEAVEVCVKHPGLGEQFLSEFGEQGLAAASRLPKGSLVWAVKNAPQLKGSGKAREIFDIVLEYGERAVNHLERHKFLYFVAAPTGYVLTQGGLDFMENPGKAIAEGIREVGPAASQVIKEEGGDGISSFFFATAGIFLMWGALSIYLRHRRKLKLDKSK